MIREANKNDLDEILQLTIKEQQWKISTNW